MFKKLKLFLPIIILVWLFPGFWRGNIQWIEFKFCENVWKWMQANKIVKIQPWESQEICLNFTSEQNEDEEITYWFIEATMKDWIRTCQIQQKLEDENPFIKLFSNDNWNQRKIIIKANESKDIKEKINVPIWMSWMVYWCFGYKAKPVTSKMFNIESLWVKPIDLFIWWSADIKNSIKLLNAKWNTFSSNNKIWITTDKENKIFVNLLIKNQWNVTSNVSIKWSISNALWFEKTFEIPAKLIWIWSETEIKSEPILLPAYKWFFNISTTLTAEPKLEFNADILWEDAKKTFTIEESWQIFIFTRIWIIIGILALLIIRLILRPLFKKHKVE